MDVSSEIRIDGVITAAKDLDVNSVAENRLVKSSTTMADLSTGLTLEILGTATPFNEAVYYADLKTSSLISIGNEASLSALIKTYLLTLLQIPNLKRELRRVSLTYSIPN